MASVRQRRSVSVSARAGLIQNQEEAEEEEEDFMDTGVLDTISQRYESLDYFTNFNSLLLDEIRRRGYKFVTRTVSECMGGYSSKKSLFFPILAIMRYFQVLYISPFFLPF